MARVRGGNEGFESGLAVRRLVRPAPEERVPLALLSPTHAPTAQRQGSVKTYLCATGRIAEGHDLEALARLAVDRGPGLSDEDWRERIIRVDEIYFSHIGWNAKCLSRCCF